MPEIKVFCAPDGRITIRRPKGQLPDRATVELVCEAIEQHRKSPSANGSSRKGSTENGTKGQTEYTASGAENQEGG